MVKEIDGEKWFCCPYCGKKLFRLAGMNPSAKGIMFFCRKCKKEIVVDI